MTYAGLTIADKPALLDAKARGAEWVARDKNIVLGGFKHEPVRKTIVLPNGIPSTTTWNDEIEDFWIELNDCDLSFVTWSSGSVNIDLALAQIADMEKAQKPRTVASVLLERWAKDTEAMASRMIGYDESEPKFFTTNIDGEITNRYEHVRLALEAQIAYLNSAAEVGK